MCYRTPRRIYLVTLALLAIGCSHTEVKDLDFEEQDLEAPSVQVSKEVNETFSLDLEQTRIEGEGVRPLADGTEKIRVDDVEIYGPAELDTRYELKATRLGVGINVLRNESVHLKVDAGLNRLGLRLGFSDEDLRARSKDHDNALYGRFRARFPIAGPLWAGGHIGYSRFLDFDDGDMVDVGLTLSLDLGENLQLYGGWFNWNYRNEQMRSEVSIDAEGALYGLRFTF